MNYALELFVLLILKPAVTRKRKQKIPQLEIDIVALAEPESQINPKFQTMFKYTRITAKAMREALMTKKAGNMKNYPVKSLLAKF